MLTNLFYFSHYFRLNGNRSVNNLKRNNSINFSENVGKKVAASRLTNTMPKNSTFVLNPSFSPPAITYANRFSKGIMGLFDSSKMFIQDGQYIHKLIHRNPAAKGQINLGQEWLYEDLIDFVNSFNSIMELSNNGHSERLLGLSMWASEFAARNYNVFAEFGIQLADNKLKIGEKSTFSAGNLPQALGVFEEAYSKMFEFLKEPLAAHMKFRELNYYYNYRILNIEKNAAGLMDEGIIVNIAL